MSAALRHVFTTRTSLARAARAIKGWRRLVPPRQTDSSPRRYAKSTWLQQERNKVPAQALLFGNDVEAQSVKWLVATSSGKGFPLTVPVVHPPGARRRR